MANSLRRVAPVARRARARVRNSARADCASASSPARRSSAFCSASSCRASASLWRSRRRAPGHTSASAARSARADLRLPAAAPAMRRCSRRRSAAARRKILELRLDRVARVEVRLKRGIDLRQLPDALPDARRAAPAPLRRCRKAPHTPRRTARCSLSALPSTRRAVSSSSSSPARTFGFVELADLKLQQIEPRGFLALVHLKRVELGLQPPPFAKRLGRPLARRRPAPRTRRASAGGFADRAASDARAARAARRAARSDRSSAAAVTSVSLTNARLRPCALISRRTIEVCSTDWSNTACTCAWDSPVRMRSADARPPMSRPTASTSIDLPAPVSPVRTFSPGSNSTWTASMTARCSMRRKRSISRPASPQSRRSCSEGGEGGELQCYHMFDSRSGACYSDDCASAQTLRRHSPKP